MTKDITPELIANWHKEIEEFLARTSHRELFTATEIQNFLLDLRNLSSAELKEIESEISEPAGASSESDPTVT